LLAIPLHLLGKRSYGCYIACFLVNSAAGGIAASVLMPPLSWKILITAAPAAAALLLPYVLLRFTRFPKAIAVLIGFLLNTLFTALSVMGWIHAADTLAAAACFFSVIAYFYLAAFGLTVGHEERYVLRDISLSSFGAVIIVAAAAFVVATEGEGLEDAAEGLGSAVTDGFSELASGGETQPGRKKK